MTMPQDINTLIQALIGPTATTADVVEPVWRMINSFFSRLDLNTAVEGRAGDGPAFYAELLSFHRMKRGTD